MWRTEDLRAEDRLPGRRIGSSDNLGWRSALARIYEEPAEAEEFTTLTTPDHLVVLQLQGSYDIESQRGATWTRARYRPGSMGAIMGGASNVLRWRSSAPTLAKTLQIHLDADLVSHVTEEVRAARGRCPPLPDALEMRDPVARAACEALGAGVRTEMDPLCADSIALGLAFRLATAELSTRPESSQQVRALNGRSVQLVIEYMAEHISEPVELDHLAELATVSKFHFVRTFAAATGETPYAYLTRMRLDLAAKLLATTDQSEGAIAQACGYASAARLAHAFRRRFGGTPRQFRDEHHAR